MIIGGVGGVCRTGSYKIGYKVAFFPIAVNMPATAIDNAVRSAKPAEYTFILEIRNLDDTQWINVGECTYIQVSSNVDGGGSGFFTIRNTDKWSIEGTQNPDILEPSGRAMRLLATMKIAGTSYITPMFLGFITNYSESHGSSDGAISISARNIGNALQNRPTKNLQRLTAYRLIADELAESGFIQQFLAPIMLADDRVIGTESFSGLIDLITGVISGAVDVTTSSNGAIVVSRRGQTVPIGSTFTIPEETQISISKSLGRGTAYNTVSVIGLGVGGITQQIAQDTDDVARRGVVRSPRIYGTPDTPIETNVANAERWIAEMLRGLISIQIRLNPFLLAGAVVKIQSERLFITDKIGRVGAVTHRFSDNAAETTLSSVGLLE